MIEVFQNGVRSMIDWTKRALGEKKVGRPTTEDRLSKVHGEALDEFDRIQSAVRNERLQCLQDRRFYSISGAMWEGPLQDQYISKPKFEVNKVMLAIIRIFNEYRNNRITVDFISKDGADAEKLAETCNGLYRADEQDSGAQEAYDNAFEEGVGGGFGAWRLRTKYEDEENPDDERQRICIEPIFDADSSVFFDLDAKRQDKADAKRCFVLTSMTHGAYRAEYGDDPATWPKEIHQYEFDWATPDVVYVAEYYVVELKKYTLYVYESLTGERKEYADEDFNENTDLREELEALGFSEIEQKKKRTRKVHKYILSGSKILEDCGYIAGKCIPVVPMYGKRWFVDNVERCCGHVRLAKDPARVYNMQFSRLGETASLSPIAKPIFTPEQMLGHTVMWSEDNIKNFPYLLVNSMTDANGQPMPAGPVAYTKPPEIPPAMAAILQLCSADLQEILGNQQAGEELQANVSGKAVELVQNKIDMRTFIYMSNMEKAVKRSGEIWLSMQREIAVQDERRMKTIGPQGEVGSVVLRKPVIGENDERTLENDLSEANFDVVATVGPTSDSKRAATVRALTGMMAITQDPETLQVLGSMVMLNMEGEGISDVRDFFRKRLLKMGVVTPTDEEAEEMMVEAQNTPPDPQQKLLDAAAEEAAANAASAKASTVLKIEQAEKTRAETGKAEAETIATIAGIERDKTQQAIETVQTFANLEIETARAARDTATTEP